MSPEVGTPTTDRVLQDSPPYHRASWDILSRRLATDLPKFASSGGWRAARRLSSVPGARPNGRRQIQVRKSPENPGQFRYVGVDCHVRSEQGDGYALQPSGNPNWRLASDVRRTWIIG